MKKGQPLCSVGFSVALGFEKLVSVFSIVAFGYLLSSAIGVRDTEYTHLPNLGTCMYREGHMLANLGWIEFNLGYSTVLPSCSATSANFPSVQAELGRGLNSSNQCQPNPGLPADAHPCTLV